MTVSRMLRFLRFGLFLFLAGWVASPATASAQGRGPWQVVELSGAVTVAKAGIAAVALTDTTELEGGEQIQTAASGRVILRRGGDTIVVAPNSLMALPARDTGLITRILQTFGTVLVNVEKRPNPNFEVRTPFLAAIVKGTTFTVSADAVGSAVHVVEGVVAVADAARANSVTVTAGQTARINTTRNDGLRVEGRRDTAPANRDGAAGTRVDTGGKERSAGAAGEGHGLRRISQSIGAGSIDAGRASGGLVRNEHGQGRAAVGAGERRGGAEPSQRRYSAGLNVGPPSGLIRANNGQQANNGNAGGNGNGNGGGAGGGGAGGGGAGGGGGGGGAGGGGGGGGAGGGGGGGAGGGGGGGAGGGGAGGGGAGGGGGGAGGGAGGGGG